MNPNVDINEIFEASLEKDLIDLLQSINSLNPCREVAIKSDGALIQEAFKIPFDKLPLYINHENEIIRSVSLERLKNP